MSDVFSAPEADPNFMEVPLEGVEYRATVSQPSLFLGAQLYVDGEKAPRGSKRGTYGLPDGRDATLSGMYTRTAPTVNIGDEAYELGEPLNKIVMVLQFSSFLLVILGGLIGALIAAPGLMVNQSVARSDASTPAKIAIMLTVTGVTFVVWVGAAVVFEALVG